METTRTLYRTCRDSTGILLGLWYSFLLVACQAEQLCTVSSYPYSSWSVISLGILSTDMHYMYWQFPQSQLSPGFSKWRIPATCMDSQNLFICFTIHQLKQSLKHLSSQKWPSTGMQFSQRRFLDWSPWNISSQNFTHCLSHTTCGALQPVIPTNPQKVLYWLRWPRAGIVLTCWQDTGARTGVAVVEPLAVLTLLAHLNTCLLLVLHWDRLGRDCTRCGWSSQ